MCYPLGHSGRWQTPSEYKVHPLSDSPKITVFRQVYEDAVDKIIMLDPWPTFLIKECIDILLPSLKILVNFPLMEGCIHDAFKSAVVTLRIKKPNLPPDDVIALYLASVLYQKW